MIIFIINSRIILLKSSFYKRMSIYIVRVPVYVLHNDTEVAMWWIRPRGYKKVMLNSAEHEISKLISTKKERQFVSGSGKPRMLFSC